MKNQFVGRQASQGLTTTKPSKTQPNQTLSIKRILQNHTRNVPHGAIEHKPMYFGQAPIEEMKDLTEIKERAEKLNQHKRNIQNKINEEFAEKQRKFEVEFTEDEIREMKKEIAEKKQNSNK